MGVETEAGLEGKDDSGNIWYVYCLYSMICERRGSPIIFRFPSGEQFVKRRQIDVSLWHTRPRNLRTSHFGYVLERVPSSGGEEILAVTRALARSLVPSEPQYL